MSVVKPYYHIWRPVKGVDMFFDVVERRFGYGYLYDNRFVNPCAFRILSNAAKLITIDLEHLFLYIEPTESNLSVYSHRIYNLFVRTAIEFEANCKSILKANNYSKGKSSKYNINDYNKIVTPTRLSEYVVHFNRCEICDIMPFKEWGNNGKLSWYKDYNAVKHNSIDNFHLANLDNLFKAVAGLYCILYAQFGHRIDGVISINGIASIRNDVCFMSNDFVSIKAPSFPEEEMYEFEWAKLREDVAPFERYPF